MALPHLGSAVEVVRLAIVLGEEAFIGQDVEGPPGVVHEHWEERGASSQEPVRHTPQHVLQRLREIQVV